MLKKEIKKTLNAIDVHKFKFMALTASYFTITEVILKLPYLNLFVFDFPWKLFIFYILFVLWLRPSNAILIFVSIIFLPLGKFSEVFGILIYISLLLVLIKFLIDKKRK